MDIYTCVRGRFIDIVEEMFNLTLNFHWLEHTYHLFLRKAFNLTHSTPWGSSGCFVNDIAGQHVIF